jgi:hypothetical protein
VLSKHDNYETVKAELPDREFDRENFDTFETRYGMFYVLRKNEDPKCVEDNTEAKA